MSVQNDPFKRREPVKDTLVGIASYFGYMIAVAAMEIYLTPRIPFLRHLDDFMPGWWFAAPIILGGLILAFVQKLREVLQRHDQGRH